MIFKIKRIKGLLTRRSDAIKRILTDLKGFGKEEFVFGVVERVLRIVIREKAEKGKLGLRGLTNIEFCAGRYAKGEPYRDIWIKIIYPEELQGLVIDIDIKSSEKYAKEHRGKSNTSVVIVSDKDKKKPMKIAMRIYHIIFERIRDELKRIKNSPDSPD